MRGHYDDVALFASEVGWKIGKDHQVSVTVVVAKECHHVPCVVVVVVVPAAAAAHLAHACIDFEVADQVPFVAEVEAAAEVDTTAQLMPLVDIPNSYCYVPVT